MYADDLALVSSSLTELQIMVDICCKELEIINLKLNVNKSVCLRIGKRCFRSCRDLITPYGSIGWAKEVKYLGVTIVCGNRFKLSFDDRKCKFYAQFNAIYSKLGNLADPSVSLYLMETVAMPILLYGIEAVELNKTEIRTLESPLNRVLYKLFKISDTDNRAFCMDMFGIMSINDRYIKRKNKFLDSLKMQSDSVLRRP